MSSPASLSRYETPGFRVALENLQRSVVGAVVGGDHEIDAGVQMERDLRVDDVHLVPHEQSHDELHAWSVGARLDYRRGVSDETDALLVESRRLRRENRLLRQQVESFRASRWWRLHPRFLLRREGETVVEEQEREPGAERRPTSSTGGVTSDFREAVVGSLTVSRDTFTDRIDDLDPIVRSLAGRHARVLEIGSYEGMSSCYFLWRLPDCHVTCIDTFRGGVDDRVASSHPRLEEVFDGNIAHVDPAGARVTKIVDDSRAALLELQARAARFDLVYVDGSHLALDVMVDAALAWRIVPTGGVIVFDDYCWNDLGEDRLLRPGPAIDAVLDLLSAKYELLHSGAQLAIRKVVESP